MAQRELDLFECGPSLMGQLGVGAAQIVSGDLETERGERSQTRMHLLTLGGQLLGKTRPFSDHSGARMLRPRTMAKC